MHLIFGGAYQGKLEYAKERYELKDEDIFICGAGEGAYSSVSEKEEHPSASGQGECSSAQEIDFHKKAVYRLEDFILNCVRCGREAKDYIEENRGKWNDTVFICTDISSGVVPFEKELRDWREMVGRTLMYLGKEAEEVTRLFCGLPQRIK